MKKVVTITAIMLLCMVLGYCIGLGINALVSDGVEGESIDKMKLLWTVAVAFVALVVSFLANTLLHEVGHLVGGLLTGYKFLSLRVGNMTLQKENDVWHWKKFNIAGTLGQCLMCPPHTQEVPYFWYNAGGVLVNLLICLVSGAWLLFADFSILGFSFSAMLLYTGIFLFIMNAVPMKMGGVPNDGLNILILWKHPEQRKHFHNMMAVAAGQSRGIRLKDMPQEWFESDTVTTKSTTMELSARSLHYSRLMDELRFDEARQVTEEMMGIGDAMPGLFKLEVVGDRLLLELLTHNRLSVVSELWNTKANRMEASKYIQTYKIFMPLKCAILYAYEFINNQNPEAAEPYYEEVNTKLDTYTQKGEALTALEVMNHIKGSRN